MTRDGADHETRFEADLKLLRRAGRFMAVSGAFNAVEAHFLEVCDARLDVNLPLTPKMRRTLSTLVERVETQEFN